MTTTDKQPERCGKCGQGLHFGACRVPEQAALASSSSTTTDTLSGLRAVYAGGTPGPYKADLGSVLIEVNDVWVELAGTADDADARKIVAQERMAAPGLALAVAVEAVLECTSDYQEEDRRMNALSTTFDAWMAAAAKAAPG